MRAMRKGKGTLTPPWLKKYTGVLEVILDGELAALESTVLRLFIEVSE